MDWETPQDFFDEIDNEFHFTLDACANEMNHKCDKYFSESDDGLKQNWGGRQSGVTRRMVVRSAIGFRNVRKSQSKKTLLLLC